MATVSSLGINFVTTGGTTTVVATPALRDLIVIVTGYTGIATAIAPTDNNADGHGTYRPVVNSLKNTSADFLGLWVRADAIQSATSTTFSIAPGASTGGGLEVFKITGMTIAGPAAVRQSGSQSNQAGSTAPAPALSVGAALTTNPLIGAVLNGTNPATMTAPTGFTESQDTGYTVPATGLETVFASSGITASTITWLSATTVYCDVVAEFDARPGQQSTFPPRGGEALDVTMSNTPKLQAVKRASTWCFGDKWARRGRLWVPKPGILVPA